MRDMGKAEVEFPEPPFAIDDVVAHLRRVREGWRDARSKRGDYGAVGFPSRHALGRIIDVLAAALFPLRLGPAEVTAANEDIFVAASLQSALPLLAAQVRMELHYSYPQDCNATVDAEVNRIVTALAARLPEIRRLLDSDVEAAFDGDPAARCVDEVLLCYPFVTAVLHHRVAHELYKLGAPLVARILAEIAHSRTGIDIHPGATIGERFFIDHGTGVVIGQTAIIGKRVRIYQAVTLGARSFSTDEEGRLVKDEARHPIIEDDVTIYAGATILGRVTIGRCSVIGGNVWLTRSVPPGSRVRQTQASVTVEAGDPCD
ncbi:serine O-acetyltransferase EpsC [Novosphingobium capsulatum]|uniref:serine O-acetyltransferase EpsC n=1 Tax=Novosphingobium capsulatum TaxID=13688 RepID=UPI000786B097|nr:serine O-acetyltransferase EpsC [Novosphingobium capsulatum]WQD91354.1 serine O-acetyltransferase EpsC [Novosphingobium capsulatum]